MFESLRRYASHIARSISTTRHQILMMVYVTHLWESIRKHYIESRTRDQEVYCGKLFEDQRAHHYAVAIKDDYLFSSVQYDRKISNEYSQQAKKKAQSTSLKAPDDIFTRVRLTESVETFDCPIPEMSKYLRIYQNFATAYMGYSVIKYGFVSMLYYEWFDIDKTYACYLPGRLGLLLFVAYQLPWFAFVVYSLHIFERFLWLIHVDQLELDCLLFLCYDKDTIMDKQFEIVQLNGPNLLPRTAYRMYLYDKVFYDKQLTAKGRTKYVMKQHRTSEYYDNLSLVAMKLTLLAVLGIASVYIPLIIYCSYLITTPEFFEISYPSCRSFFTSKNILSVRLLTWSLYDVLRLSYMLFDLLDNLIFWLHLILVVVVPYSVAIITTHDLGLRFDSLSSRVSDINERFRFLLSNCSHDRDMTSSKITPSTMKFLQRLEEESESIFRETVSLFEHVRSVDEYMRRFASFALMCWLVLNMSLQAFTIFRFETLTSDQWLMFIVSEIYMHLITIFVFVLLARPYSRTQVLYAKLSSAMALCPNIPTTKISWLWILEYYHGRSSRHTLHLLGQSYALSNLNILRCMSWFVTGTLILLNLIKQKTLFV